MHSASLPKKAPDEDGVADGRIGWREIRLLGGSLAAAIVAYAIPVTRLVLSALVTLFHELGHAAVSWPLGQPAIPAFDFVYGGGFTHQGEFHLSIALAVGAGFGWLAWRLRHNRSGLSAVALVFGMWLIAVSSEWRRELVFASAGHVSELVLAAILFYKALAGVGWQVPELERPLGAFAAFFVQIHSMLFALRLRGDPAFLAWYREGKGGALMNDLEIVALDLNIHFGFNPGISGVAGFLLAFSVVPIGIALLWYLRRSRWHRVLRAMEA